MKKLLGLLAATGLVASTGASVVACQSSDKTDISTLELELTLGNVEGADSQLTDTEIINAFVTNTTNAPILANAELTESSFEVTGEPTTTGATIAVKSDVTTHTGSVDVTFTRVKIDISTLELEVALDEIEGADSQLTDTEIIDAFVTNTTNATILANAGLTKSSFDVTEITSTGATITVKSNVTTHTGSVNVTFTNTYEDEEAE